MVMASYELSDKEIARLVAETDLSPTREDKLQWVAMNRRGAENDFRRPIQQVISSTQPAIDVKEVDVIEVSEGNKNSLASEFQSGNYVFHSSTTEGILGALKSGNLANIFAINEDAEAVAREEGKLDEFVTIRGNSGVEGISWSINGIDAMPGTRYHVAGFLASPENILPADNKFCVPSRPAPFEVLQVPKKIDTVSLYEKKIQWELIYSMSPWGEDNSIASGLMKYLSSVEEDVTPRLPSDLRDFYDTFKSSVDKSKISDELRKYAHFENGQVVLDPALQEQDDILVSAVWLQCLVDNNCFQGTPLEGKNLEDVFEAMENGDIGWVLGEYVLQRDALLKEIEVIAEDYGRVETPVSEMYFVCPKEDVNLWQAVIAQMEVKPKGIVAYDGHQIRLENFANKSEGHNQELDAAIRLVIGEGDHRRLTWDIEVLGTPFDDSMRRGHSNQCVGNEFIGNSKILISNGTDLKITDPHIGTGLTI